MKEGCSPGELPPPPAREFEGEVEGEGEVERPGEGGEEARTCASGGGLTSVRKAGPLARLIACEISPARTFTTTRASSIFFVFPAWYGVTLSL